MFENKSHLMSYDIPSSYKTKDSTPKMQLQTQNLTSGLIQTDIPHRVFGSTGY